MREEDKYREASGLHTVADRIKDRLSSLRHRPLKPEEEADRRTEEQRRTSLSLDEQYGFTDADGDGDVDADDRTAVNDALGLCAADIDGDGQVDGADLGKLLAVWSSTSSDYGDLDGNGAVDGADLTILLGNWGLCI